MNGANIPPQPQYAQAPQGAPQPQYAQAPQGAPQPQFQQAPQYQQPVYTNSAPQIPDNYKPVSAWGYVGYNILFCIPLVGLILLIVFSFSDKNINRRNYARSFFCTILLSILISVILSLVFGVSLMSAFG